MDTKRFSKFSEHAKQCKKKCRSKQHTLEMINAVSKGTFRQVQLYLSTCHNALTLTDPFGRTVLHIAASCGSSKLLQWLLPQLKNEKEVKDNESLWTALHRALFYGQIAAAKILIRNGANLYAQDKEGSTPLNLLIKDRSEFGNFEEFGVSDVYTWGDNSNFTLGHDGSQSRKIPEVVEVLRRTVTGIKQVVINQYHTVFLSEEGQVYTCGHGQGGRLGHGNEQTCLAPRLVESLKKDICIAIAASRDNTFMLTESGVAYSCGLNEYHQLGQVPPPPMSLIPKQVGGRKMKGQHIRGICSEKYHGVIYTDDALYTFGSNGGQLGHMQLSNEPLVTQPRLVSAFNYSSVQIKQVTACEAATIVVTTKGDIHLIYQNKSKRILIRRIDVRKVCIAGGELDSALRTEHHHRQSLEELTLLLLTNAGKIELWRPSWGRVKHCCDLKQKFVVSDVAFTSNLISFTTTEGLAYKAQLNITANTMTSPRSKDRSSTSAGANSSTFTDCDDIIDMTTTMLSQIHRATHIAADKKGTNFAVLQIKPEKSITELPVVSKSLICQQFKDFLSQTDPYDLVHDVVLHIGDQIFAAHKFILACRSNLFRKMLCNKSNNCCKNSSKTELYFTYPHPYIFIQMLHYIYSDTCDIFNSNIKWREIEKSEEIFDIGISNLTEEHSRDDENHIRKVNLICSCLKCTSSDEQKGKSNVNVNPLKVLRDLSSEFGVTGLLDRLKTMRFKDGKVQLFSSKQKTAPSLLFDREIVSDFFNITIKAEDGTMMNCHKCILMARVEYFERMLSSNWIETSQTDALSLPITGDILNVIMDFIYTDKSSIMNGYRDMDFICRVLVMADQLLIERLKQLCELSLAGMIGLKTCCELLEFASVYCAEQLKAACQQFITFNLATLLEARTLDFLSEEVTEEFTVYYKCKAPSIESRKLTPYSGLPSHTDLEELETMYNSTDLRGLQVESLVKTPAKSRRRKSSYKEREETDVQANTTSLQQAIQRTVSESSEVESMQKQYTIEVKPTPTPKEDISSAVVIQTAETVTETTAHSDMNDPDEHVSSVTSLRDIMAQEEKSKKKQPGPKNQTKKMSKVSQKARKKHQAKETLNTEEEKAAVPQETPAKAWCPVDKIIPSFRDLMKDDEVKMDKHVTSESGDRKHVTPLSPTDRFKSPSKLSLKITPSKKMAAEGADDGVRRNAWSCPAKSPDQPVTSPTTLSLIMQEEKQQDIMLGKATNKPLALLQIEDQAMQELLQYYTVADTYNEHVTVERVTSRRAQPKWTTS